MVQWRTQDFRMGGVEMPQAPRGEGNGEGHNMGRGIPLPTGGRVWKGGPIPRKFFVFFG